MFGVMDFSTMLLVLTMKDSRRGRNLLNLSLVCELYIAVETKRDKKFCKTLQRISFNSLGKELSRLQKPHQVVSNSWTNGFYMRPRTDHHDLEKYHEGANCPLRWYW